MSVRDSMPQVWEKIRVCLDGTSISLNNSKLSDITLCTASWLMSKEFFILTYLITQADYPLGGFISNLPVETVLRVWDSFFYEGSKILFRISLALFKLAENAVKNVAEPIEVFQIIQTMPRKCIDAGALMDLCFKRRNGYGHLSQQQIDERRNERREMLERERKMRLDGELDADGALPRGSKDDMALRKGFAAGLGVAGFGDEAGKRLKKYYHKKK